MAKVKNPLFSGDVSGDFGKKMIFRKGGVVTRYFRPKNPQTEAQQAHRTAFRNYYMASLTQAQADLLYAAISHLHDHGNLTGLGDDDHLQYFNQARGDARYKQIGIEEAFPVGSIYISVLATNPATALGYGEWVSFGGGRVLVGHDAGQIEFDTAEETGGAKTHTLIESEMPVHTHIQDAHNHIQNAHAHTTPGDSNSAIGTLSRFMGSSGGGANINVTASSVTATNIAMTAVNRNAGGGAAHNNLQPYIVVYMWKRVS